MSDLALPLNNMVDEAYTKGEEGKCGDYGAMQSRNLPRPSNLISRRPPFPIAHFKVAPLNAGAWTGEDLAYLYTYLASVYPVIARSALSEQYISVIFLCYSLESSLPSFASIL